MGLRIIFREVEDTIHLIQIAALGKRDKEKINKLAEERPS